MKNLKKYFNKLIAIILPNRCLYCNQFIAEEEIFCDLHKNKIEFIKNSAINQNNHEEFYFDQLSSIFLYNEYIAKIIFNLKYYDQIFLKKKLGELLAKNLMNIENCHEYDFIIPVPIHKKRLKERKFNQSALLAKEIIKYHKNIKFYSNFLIRTKYSKAQAKLTKQEREKNLLSSFEINKKYQNIIKNKKIILVDDVFTTGSTVNNCAKILKKYGADKILILTLAKTILKK